MSLLATLYQPAKVGVVRTLEFKPEDFPVTIRLTLPEGEKEYVLLRTKQDKLLLNKRIEVSAEATSSNN